MDDGSTFAGYTLVHCLGAGGMGEVYVAAHPRLPRQDALKVLKPEISADGDYRERFLQEADFAATLTHPHIVGVYDRGEDHGQLWIAMDYVDGPDAGELLQQHHDHRLPPAQVAQIITAVADALDYAHQRNLLHRDVKPANILVGRSGSDDGRIMLADFGIARRADDPSGLTATNMTIGTVSYAAPEQLTGAAMDGRADQYALAATAFHLLSGAPPFQDPNAAVVIGHHLNTPPPSLGIPELAGADAVLAKALAKNPQDRFDKCADFARALAHQLGATGSDETRLSAISALTTPEATPQTTDAMPVPAAARGRRSLLLPIAVAILLVAVIALAVTQFDLFKDEQRAPAKPEATTTAVVPHSATAPPTTTAPSTEPTVTVTSTEDVQPTDTVTTVVTTTVAPTTTDTNSATSTTTTSESPQPQEESPIRECMQQTGKTRLQCWEEIRRSRRG